MAGRDLFRENCEICHAYDGGGRTRIGGREYPHAPPLRVAVRSMSDGEMFYHIRNGIRNTGMPAWDMPDRQIWQLVAYIRRLPSPARMAAAEPPESDREGPATSATYVGSAACKKCHEEIYARWSKSRMANVVRDPREHPDAIIPDFSKPDPLLTFTKDDIAFVYGSRWKQRYFTKVGDDYFPLPAQWDVTHKMWRPYFVAQRNRLVGAALSAGQFPAADRPAMRRLPFGQLRHRHQDGHRVERRLRAMPRTGQRARGAAGGEHHRQSRPLDYVHANDTCIQCHSQGQPLKNPIEGKYYDWPVGFHVGMNLADFWKLEEHKLGETTFTHFADGTAHKNRMQGNDFVQSLMYARGVTCFSCHDAHGTDNPGIVRKPGNGLCLACHGPNAQNGPHAATIEQHTHHAARQRRQRVRRLPHAEDRGDHRRRERPQPHLPFRYADGDRDDENSERLQSLPHRQDDGVGDGGAAKLGGSLALAGAVVWRFRGETSNRH